MVGAELDVVVCRAPPLWYTPAGLALVEPAALGLDTPRAAAPSGDAKQGATNVL